MADANIDGSVSLEEYENLIINSLKKAGVRIEKASLVLWLIKWDNTNYQKYLFPFFNN